MSIDPPPASPPGEVPPRRRLDQAPSERYGARAAPTATGDHAAAEAAVIGLPRGRGAALAVAALGAVVVIVVYGILATTIGLLAIAGGTGFLAGLALRGTHGAPGRAVLIAVGAMLVGILGSWVVSLAEGGVTGPIDYIGQTLGPLVLIVPSVAAAAAWLGSRQG